MFSTPLEDAKTAKIKKIDRGLGDIMSDLLKLIRNLLNKVKFLPNKIKKFIKYNLLLTSMVPGLRPGVTTIYL